MQTLSEQLQYFNHLSSELESAYHEANLKLGVSDSAMQILYTICSFGDRCLLSDICRLTGVSKQTIHSGLRKLEEEGTVRVEAYQGRKKMVVLTEQGKAVAERTAGVLIQTENEIFNSWAPGDRARYLELTQRYLNAFRQKIGKL